MEYKVIKEYCGIPEGKIVKCKNPATINHMIAKGHWKEVVKPMVKIEPEVKTRKKKVEPELAKRKKK